MSKQEFKRTGRVSLMIEFHYIQIIKALRQAITNGDPTRFSRDDARELESLAQDIRIIVHEQEPQHEHSVDNCEFCRESARHEEIFAGRDPDKLIELVKSLRDDLVCTEEDLCWYKAILDGSWPSAKDILTQALNKCPEGDNATV